MTSRVNFVFDLVFFFFISFFLIIWAPLPSPYSIVAIATTVDGREKLLSTRETDKRVLLGPGVFAETLDKWSSEYYIL